LPGKIGLWVVVAIAIASGADYFLRFLQRVAAFEGPMPPEP
jgi:hypothetical protein